MYIVHGTSLQCIYIVIYPALFINTHNAPDNEGRLEGVCETEYRHAQVGKYTGLCQESKGSEHLLYCHLIVKRVRSVF